MVEKLLGSTGKALLKRNRPGDTAIMRKKTLVGHTEVLGKHEPMISHWFDSLLHLFVSLGKSLKFSECLWKNKIVRLTDH